jgi:dTDP-glucose 4,6-dehydratase
MILYELGKPDSLISYVADRLGHDYLYSIDSRKIKKLGWQKEADFQQGMRKTIQWYVKNSWWWEPLLQKKEILHAD